MMPDDQQQPTYNQYGAPVYPHVVPLSPATAAAQLSTFDHAHRRVLLTPIILGAVALLLLCAAIVATFLILYHPISRADVLSAAQTADNMRNDLNQAKTGYNTLVSHPASDESALIAQVSAINASLDSAQKELSTLKNSSVLRNSNADNKFQATQSKIGAFVTYIKQNTSDEAAFLPVATQMDNSLQILFSTPVPTDAKGLSAYLQQLTSIIDSTRNGLQSLDLQSQDSKQAITIMDTYLDNLTGTVTKLQGDIATNNPGALASDVNSIQTANTTFNGAIRTLDDQTQSEQKQLDPQSSLSAFMAVLDQLAVTSH